MSGPRNVQEKLRQKAPMFYPFPQEVESSNHCFYWSVKGRRICFSLFLDSCFHRLFLIVFRDISNNLRILL